MANLFADSILIGGIGIPTKDIFNTSAPTSPIKSGSNFIPDIRAAITSAEVTICLVTPNYFERPFAMAELGAAWAREQLVPILVPPVDFKTLEGVLDGVQCLRIDEERSLHELFDRFDGEKNRWFKRNGSATFTAKMREFLAALARQRQSGANTSKKERGRGAKSVGEATPAKHVSAKEEQAAFGKFIDELNDALGRLPRIVQQAFAYEAWSQYGVAHPDEVERVAAAIDAKNRGLLELTLEGKDILFEPSNASQRARNVYGVLTRLQEFLSRASAEFHISYEDQYGCAASPKLESFWTAHVQTPWLLEEEEKADVQRTKTGSNEPPPKP